MTLFNLAYLGPKALLCELARAALAAVPLRLSLHRHRGGDRPGSNWACVVVYLPPLPRDPRDY